MKRVLLLTILTFGSLTLFSQTFYKVITSSYLKYKDGRFNTEEETHPKRMFVIYGKKQLKITNKGKDVYQLYGDQIQTTKDDHFTISSKAYDQEGESCDITITAYKGETVMYFSVFYILGGYGFQYKVDISDQLDKPKMP